MVQKGIVKTKSECNHYQCGTCKRTFRTKQQEDNTLEAQHKNKVLTPVYKAGFVTMESPRHDIEEDEHAE